MSKSFKVYIILLGLIAAVSGLFFPDKSIAVEKKPAENFKDLALCYNSQVIKKNITITKGIVHKRVTRWLGGKPAIVNIITVNPHLSGAVIRPTYGEHLLNSVKKVSDFASQENAIAAVNASFFKPDIGAPLGISIIDGELLTGPIYNRVVFGVNESNEFLMDKLEVAGEIQVGEKLVLNLVNYNQPVQTRYGFTIFTDRWGEKTPYTAEDFCHIVVRDNKVNYIKQSSVKIPEDGYVIVGPRKPLIGNIDRDYEVSYSIEFRPDEWKNVKYAVGGGPYLVKEGKIFVDKQRFTDKFISKKEPRTAIGYSRAGTLILVTVDGRRRGISEGATMHELAQIMWELGAYNAMNLDGGSSTQMVYKGQVVNLPTVKGGGKVTNALLIVPANLYRK